MQKQLLLISILALSSPAVAMEQAKTMSKANADAWDALVTDYGNFAKFAECQKSPDFDINCHYPEELVKPGAGYLNYRTLLGNLCRLPFTQERIKILEAIFSLHDKGSRKPVDVADDFWNYSALHYAGHNTDAALLQWLLEHRDVIGLDVNQTTGAGSYTVLHIVVNSKHRAHVRLLAKIPEVNPNIPNHWKKYSLHSLLFPVPKLDSDLDTIRDLGELGVETEVTDEGLTPLEICYKKSWELIPHDRAIALLAIGAGKKKEILDECIDKLAQGWLNEDFFKPHSLLKWGSTTPECVSFLIDSFEAAIAGTPNIDLDLTKKIIGFHSFDELSTDLVAAANGDIKKGHLIVINAQDRVFGMNALMWAAARGNLPLAKKLISLSANPLLFDKHGDTALHHAVRNGHIEVARYLQKTAPLALTKKNINERTPVDVAISSKKSREMFLALAE